MMILVPEFNIKDVFVYSLFEVNMYHSMQSYVPQTRIETRECKKFTQKNKITQLEMKSFYLAVFSMATALTGFIHVVLNSYKNHKIYMVNATERCCVFPNICF